MTDESEIVRDAHGRGPLLAGFQDRAGIPPGLPGWRMRDVCREIVDAANRQAGALLPGVIEAMIRAACEEYCGARMDAARKAYAELKAEVEAMRKDIAARMPQPRPAVRMPAGNGSSATLSGRAK